MALRDHVSAAIRVLEQCQPSQARPRGESDGAPAWVHAVLCRLLVADLAATRGLCAPEPDLPAPAREQTGVHLAAARVCLADVPAAEQVGAVYEAVLAPQDRRRGGTWFTPSSVALLLVEEVIGPLVDQACAARDPEAALLAVRVCDPAMGTGNLLLAAGRLLAERLARVRATGREPEPDQASADALAAKAFCEVARQCLFGVDLDPLAVEMAAAALWLEGTDPAMTPQDLTRNLRIGDALLGRDLRDAPEPDGVRDLRAKAGGAGLDWLAAFPEIGAAGGFDAVVGNPPFASPLRAGSRVTPERRLLRALAGDLGGPKADLSAYFLLLAERLTRQSGRFGMVLPDSALAATDLADIRQALTTHRALTLLWRGDGSEFNAAVVPVVACFARKGSDPPRRLLADGGRIDAVSITAEPPAGWRDGAWATLLAPDPGALLSVGVDRFPALGTRCTIAADYRDQYYGLRGAVRDGDPGEHPTRDRPALVTTGLLDPLVCRWGQSPTRFDKQRYARPLVDLSRLDEPMRRWARSRLVPKLLVATQGRMLEVVIDEDGILLPCVPVLSILPLPGRPSLPELAAVLLSPAVHEYLAASTLGTGLSPGALRVSATGLRHLPAPGDRALVREAAALLPDLAAPASRAAFADLTDRAYGLAPRPHPGWNAVLAGYLGPPAPGKPRLRT